jgi:hypothetical protein
MKSDEYKYLEDTLSGRRARNLQFEEKMSDVADPRAADRQRQLDSLTPEQRELEQRRYSLNTYGRAHMEKYGNPIVSERPLGELQIPSDQIVGSASSAPLKGHNGRERPGPWCDKNGRLILQNHSACPQTQALQIRD